jgi:hypothetical protein
MGLLRLINASRLAPLEELLAEVKNGGSSGSASPSGSSRPASTPPLVRGASAGAAVSSSSTFAAPTLTPPSATPTGAPPSALEGGAVSASSTNASVPPRPFARTENPRGPEPAPAVAKSSGAATPAETVSESPQSNGRSVHTEGITIEQIAEIKSAIQTQQKFLAELVEHASRWELDGAELRLCFSPDKQTFAGLLDTRDSLEKIRAASSKVLGRSVRVCAKIESVAAAAAAAGSSAFASTQELRARFEQDPVVRSMLQRFGGKITEVRRRQEES